MTVANNVTQAIVRKYLENGVKVAFTTPANVKEFLGLFVPDLVAQIDFTEMVPLDASFIAPSLRKTEGDIVLRARLLDTKGYRFDTLQTTLREVVAGLTDLVEREPERWAELLTLLTAMLYHEHHGPDYAVLNQTIQRPPPATNDARSTKWSARPLKNTTPNSEKKASRLVK